MHDFLCGVLSDSLAAQDVLQQWGYVTFDLHILKWTQYLIAGGAGVAVNTFVGAVAMEAHLVRGKKNGFGVLAAHGLHHPLCYIFQSYHALRCLSIACGFTHSWPLRPTKAPLFRDAFVGFSAMCTSITTNRTMNHGCRTCAIKRRRMAYLIIANLRTVIFCAFDLIGSVRQTVMTAACDEPMSKWATD